MSTSAPPGAHTATCPFRHVPAHPSDTQPCACQQPHKTIVTTNNEGSGEEEEKDDEEQEDEEEEDEDEEEEEEEIVPPSGCPIANQSVTTLAAVCRFLDAPDLVAVHRSNKQLQAASLHSHTFEAGRWTAEAWGGLRTAGGVRAELFGVEQLQSALASPLFRCFRLLTLRGWDASTLLQMLAMLASPSAPLLAGLSLRAEDAKADANAAASASAAASKPVSQKDLALVAGLRDYPSLARLQSLDIVGHPVLLQHLTRLLPPRLEALELVLQPESSTERKAGAEGNIDDLLSASHLCAVPTLKHLIVRPSRPGGLQVTVGGLRMLETVSRDAQHVESIEFLLPVDVTSLATELQQQDATQRAPSIARVHRLHAYAGPVSGVANDAPNHLVRSLACFPDLRELRVSNLRAMVNDDATLDNGGSNSSSGSGGGANPFPRWPASISSKLVDLRISAVHPQTAQKPLTTVLLLSTLAGAQLGALQRLTIDKLAGGDTAPLVDAQLAALLASTPSLRSLAVERLTIEDFGAFKHAPQLQILRDLSWPEGVEPPPPSSAAVADDATESIRSIASLFPSLTHLHVSHHESIRSVAPYAPLLRLFPSLRTVQWRRERVVPASRLAETEARWVQMQEQRRAQEAAAEETQRAAHEKAVAMRDAGLAPIAAEHNWYRGGQSQLNAAAPDMEAAAQRLRREWEQMQAASTRQAAVLAEGSRPGATADDKEKALLQARAQMAESIKHKQQIDAAVAQLELAQAAAQAAVREEFVLPEFASLALGQQPATHTHAPGTSDPPSGSSGGDAASSSASPLSAQALFGTSSGGVGGGAKGFKPAGGRAAGSKSRTSGGGRLGGGLKIGGGPGGGAGDGADAAAAAALLAFNSPSGASTGTGTGEGAAAAPFSNPFSFSAAPIVFPAAATAAGGSSDSSTASTSTSNPFFTAGAFAFGTSFVPSTTPASLDANPFAVASSSSTTASLAPSTSAPASEVDKPTQ